MYYRFAAVSRATCDAAAAAEIRFVRNIYGTHRANDFARRNADRVTSLGTFEAPDFASIQLYTQLRDLELELGGEGPEVALLPCSLTKLTLTLQSTCINWENFQPLCCLQELQIDTWGYKLHDKVQLDDSFATALPLLRVLILYPGLSRGRLNIDNSMALETSSKAVMLHLIELNIFGLDVVHMDLDFMSALKSLRLFMCTVSTVSAACSTMVLEACRIRVSLVLLTPNLRSLTTCWDGLYKLDGSRCRHALSILCKNNSSIEWVGAEPHVGKIRVVA